MSVLLVVPNAGDRGWGVPDDVPEELFCPGISVIAQSRGALICLTQLIFLFLCRILMKLSHKLYHDIIAPDPGAFDLQNII